MKLKSTQKNAGTTWIKMLLIAFTFTGLSHVSLSQVNLIDESFNTAIPLPVGWVQQNNSDPLGTTNWFQGDPFVFPANSGNTNAYIAANYQNGDGVATISDWLLTPQITLTNGDIFKFYTRGTGSNFPDNLQVRLSLSGASTNVGTLSTDLGDFTTLLLEINPTIVVGVYPDIWTQYTINITGLAAPTSGRLAFRYYATDAGPFGNNSDFIGIDDVVYTSFPPDCTGTPAPGNTISSVTNICPGLPFNLSVQNNTPGSAVTYQWQSSPDGITYTNIAGATTPTLGTSQVTSTYYQLVVTCNASATSTNSTPVLVPMAPATSCYCNSNAVFAQDEDIFNVSIGTLNNSSDCNTIAPGALSDQNLYSNYTNGTGIPAPGQVVSGGTNPFSVTIGTCGGNFTNSVAAWLDFNQDGGFTADERIYVSPGGTVGPHTETANVFIPATALNGITRLRVISVETGVPGSIVPCGTYFWGETEDYLVNVSPCVATVLASQPTDQSTICGGSVSFSVSATGSYPAFTWEQRVDASSPWTNVVNGSTVSGATTNTLTLTDVTSAMDGYEYRVIYSGSCTALDFSDAAILTVTPLIATTNVTDATICLGSAQALSITNTAAVPSTVSFASGTLALDIPDNTENGVSTDLIVSGIPAGATIISTSVKFSLTHTYCGDMLMNLKAPNGNILALDKYLTGTGSVAGVYPNTGFVNTIISSAGTAALGTVASQPITGTFRADALNTLPPAFVVTNPVGFISNATSFSDLYAPDLNGTWTLALADGGPADLGTLTSWSIDITYVAPTLATGTWSPSTGLYLDAAMTIPYAGTLENTVYASPTVYTEYTVVVETPLCTSDPLVIPVTVAQAAIGNVTNPTDASGCTAGSISFTAGADGVGPFVYQWQESPDGTIWVDIPDGGVFSGATTNTLTITNPVASMDGNLYHLVISVPSCGSSATTASAILSVHQNPTVSIAAAPYTALYPGIRTAITATLTPSGTASYQWFLNGEPIQGTNTSPYVADIDHIGTYTLDVIDANGCAASSSNSVTITTAMNTNLFIIPNPNSGQFQIRFYNQDQGTTSTRYVNIYDSKGARIMNRTFVNIAGFQRMDIDMSNSPRGVYFVEVVDAGGIRLQTGKVLIQ